MLTYTPLTAITALMLGFALYLLAQDYIQSIKLARGDYELNALSVNAHSNKELSESFPLTPAAISWLFPNDEDQRLARYLELWVTGVAMAIVTVFTLQLVPPLNGHDYYALLLDAGIITLFATGIVLTWIDVETKILPTKIIYTGGGLALACFVAAAAVKGAWFLLLPLAIAGVAYFLFYGIFWFIQPLAFGFGDVRLSFFLGAALGFISIDAAFVGFIATWLLALVGIILGTIFGTIKEKTTIAFGPWMILGAFVGVFYGSAIVNLVL